MIVRYNSNNSGGYWWLTFDDWVNLGRACWKVNWKDSNSTCPPTSATLVCDSINIAKSNFEYVTSQDPDIAGCSCCGPPHYFYREDEYYDDDVVAEED